MNKHLILLIYLSEGKCNYGLLCKKINSQIMSNLFWISLFFFFCCLFIIILQLQLLKVDLDEIVLAVSLGDWIDLDLKLIFLSWHPARDTSFIYFYSTHTCSYILFLLCFALYFWIRFFSIFRHLHLSWLVP